MTLLELQEEAGGSIPFHKFMEAALYHPDFGYYSTGIRDVGSRGDFSTWPGMSRLPARAIAKWLVPSRPRHIIEIGAGSGHLASDVLGAIGFLARWRTTYHIVEVSRPLRELQQKRLRGKKVVWHSTIGSALEAAGGEAWIFSNELVDAFPCRVFVRSGDIWKELALRLEDGRMREVLVDCAVLPDSAVFDYDIPDGSRVEVQESYRLWLESWAPAWTSGGMLTIDYGDIVPDLYLRRPSGTLRAYHHHQILTGRDVYGAFGKRDITADVNFSDLQNWGESLGWKTERLSSLGHFLADQLPRVEIPARFADAARAFQALIQLRL